MKVIETSLPGVLILEPKVFGDARGFFLESYNRNVLAQVAGITGEFVQDNHSSSTHGVIRGLHYQIQQPQGKLVRVVSGRILDVAVDIRRSSPTCSRWMSMELSSENRRIAWVPVGFAHGFRVLSEHAEVFYKTTDYWAPQYERTIIWDDPDLKIDWGIGGPPILSGKDKLGVRFRDAELFE
jgi:dTDP-4-dehydrorhamnose 3,5-epimerase